jgi:hypothetical protein
MGIQEIQDTRKTCSTIFLLAGIGLTRRGIIKYGFLSAYVDDINHEPHWDSSVYLLFRPDNIPEFQLFLSGESRKELIVEDYDYAGGYVVVVYRFPEEYKTEYNLFLEGKYSKFSKKYKALSPDIIRVIKNGVEEDTYSIHYHVFNKSEYMKKYWEDQLGTSLDPEMEMWSIPDIKGKETLDINNL